MTQFNPGSGELSDGDVVALVNTWVEAGVPQEEIEARIKAEVQRARGRKLEEIDKTVRGMKRRHRRQDAQMDSFLQRWGKERAQRVVGRLRSPRRLGRAPRRACNARTRGSRRTRTTSSSSDDPGGSEPPDELVPALLGRSG